MATGLKHLITCRCVLPQLKRRDNPPRHMFVVFSVIDDDGNFRTKFAQCNCCGIVHKVTEINRSEILAREAMPSLRGVDDIKPTLPARLAELLEGSHADLASWEMAQFIIDNKQWGSFVVLNTDEESGMRQGKYVKILGENLIRVETFTRDEVIT